MEQKITILLVDDHPLARQGVRTALEQADDLEIVAEAQNGQEAIQLVASLQPDILLLDLKMPGIRAAEVEAWVREHHPATITLVLTAHDRDFYLSEMIEAGVAGYLDKNQRGEQLVEAIRRAAAGENLFTEQQLERALRWREGAGDKWQSLTGREHEVAQLLVQGLNDAALAKALNISLRTASHHVASLLKKLAVASRQEAVAWLIRNIPDVVDELIEIREK
ncbi:MAG: response regulator transcription factor [Anaerolineae bacterium]|nr:response regulator transcription factor [Anaerolineae bacterium]